MEIIVESRDQNLCQQDEIVKRLLVVSAHSGDGRRHTHAVNEAYTLTHVYPAVHKRNAVHARLISTELIDHRQKSDLSGYKGVRFIESGF